MPVNDLKLTKLSVVSSMDATELILVNTVERQKMNDGFQLHTLQESKQPTSDEPQPNKRMGPNHLLVEPNQSTPSPEDLGCSRSNK